MIITRQKRHYTKSTFSRIGIELIINTVNSYELVKKKFKTNLRWRLLRIQESRGWAYKLCRVNMDDKLHTNYFTFLPSFPRVHMQNKRFILAARIVASHWLFDSNFHTFHCISLKISGQMWPRYSCYLLRRNDKKRLLVDHLLGCSSCWWKFSSYETVQTSLFDKASTTKLR